MAAVARVPSVSPDPYYDANSYRALANNRPVLIGVAELGSKLLREGSLPPRVREAVILMIVGSLRCDYEIHYHTRGGLAAGLTTAEIVAARNSDEKEFPDAEALALRYVNAFMAQDVDDAIWDATTKHYTPGQMVELGVLAGYYAMIARSIAALDVQLDQGVT